jgi:MOSC domain-containing protein YiiM
MGTLGLGWFHSCPKGNVAKKTRRNIVVKGINLLSLKSQQFQIGEVILETTGLCHPCSRMEEVLDPEGIAMGDGGITARIVRGGRIRIGDEVKGFASHPK